MNEQSNTEFGLLSGELRLVEVGPEWAARFIAERERIATNLGVSPLDIEHIGSTAIPGILAKPILDLALLTPSFEAGFARVAKLVDLGYEYRGENGIARRHYFVRGTPRRTHHLHMLEPNSAQLLRHLGFRRLLLASPSTAAKYSELKRANLVHSGGKREVYQELKSAYIEDVSKLWGEASE